MHDSAVIALEMEAAATDLLDLRRTHCGGRAENDDIHGRKNNGCIMLADGTAVLL